MNKDYSLRLAASGLGGRVVKDRYGNGVEAYARRALLLARVDYERGYLTRTEFARVTESLQDIVLQYEIVNRRQEKTPKA